MNDNVAVAAQTVNSKVGAPFDGIHSRVHVLPSDRKNPVE